MAQKIIPGQQENTPQSFTNSAAAGGTFHYINLGGLKILWGVTNAQSIGNSGYGNFTVTFPAGFFTSVQHFSGSLYYPTGVGWQTWVENNSVSTASGRLTAFNSTGATQSPRASILVVGV